MKIAVGALTGSRRGPAASSAPRILNELIKRNVSFSYLAINPHSGRNQAPWSCIQFQQSFCDIQKIRNILVNKGRSSVRLWVTEFGWQVGGFTSRGTDQDVPAGIPGNENRLALWPSAGQVRLASGVARQYSQHRAAPPATTTSSLTSAHCRRSQPDLTEVSSPAAEATHATYVREAMRMVKGTYRPAAGRPAAELQLRPDRDLLLQLRPGHRRYFGMYGLHARAEADFGRPGNWTPGRAASAANVFEQETG